MWRWCVILLTFLLGCSAVLAELVTVKVLDTEGKPVAGAQVAIIYLNQIKFTAAAELVTDMSGACSSDVKWPTKAVIGFPNRFVAVYKAGYALGGQYLSPDANSIILQKPTPITGRVVDELGQPVAGAKLAIYGVQISEKKKQGVLIPEQWQAQFTLITDDKGQWIFAEMPATAEYGILRFNDTRFANSVSPIKASEKPMPTLVAYPASTLLGRVLTPDGKGAPGIYVHASFDNESGNAVTDINGNYRMTGIRAGTYTLDIIDPELKFRAEPMKDVTTTVGKEATAPDIKLIEVGK